MANRNFPNSRIYTPHVMPVLLDCNFVVDSTNGNGLGIRSLKGGFVQSVFMHTSATADPSNPNPEAGIILVTLQDKYMRYFGGFAGAVAPLTGSALTATTAGVPSVITALGTATLAQWQAAGLPVTATPTVGLAFIPTATGTIGGSATVKVAAISGITSIEVIGDPNIAIQQGLPIIMQCLAPTDSATTTLIPTAPVDNSVISLSFYLSNSSVMLAGE